MNLFLLLVFIAIYTVISLRNIRLALFLLLFSLPFYVIRFSLFALPMTLLELMLVICFSVFAFRNFKHIFSSAKTRLFDNQNWKSSRYPFDLEIALVLLISFSAIFVGGASEAAFGIWKAYFLEALIVYILVISIFFVTCKNNLWNYFLSLALPLSLSALMLALYAIFQKFTGFGIPNELWAAPETRRVTSFLAYPNALGLYLGPIAVLSFSGAMSLYLGHIAKCDRQDCSTWSPFSMDWFREMSKRDKWLFVTMKLSFFCSLLAICFARSEGALIALLGSIFVILFFLETGKLFSKLRVLLLSSSVFVLLFVLAIAPLRLEFMNQVKLDDFSGQIRKAQWEETVVMLRDGKWVTGSGLAKYKEAIEPYHKNGIYIRNNDPDFDERIKSDPNYQADHWQALEIFLYPHNLFFNFWVELGLAGMLLFLWIILKSVYLSLKTLKIEKEPKTRVLILAALGAMLVVIIHGIVDVPYFKNDLSVLFWLIVSLSGASSLLYNLKSAKNIK